jgi:hypothetical protein
LVGPLSVHRQPIGQVAHHLGFIVSYHWGLTS